MSFVATPDIIPPIALADLATTTASRALVSSAGGVITPATTTSTEIGYVNGVTSAIQTQLNAKVSATTANQQTATGAGTSYVLTTTPAAVDFGTTDPTITLTAAGTYLVRARFRVEYNGATFAASRTFTASLNRTNNTPAQLSDSRRFFNLPVVTTLSASALLVDLEAVYTTAVTDDIITIFGDISVLPSAGTLEIAAIDCYIQAHRLQQ